jgi:hypothetical protein
MATFIAALLCVVFAFVATVMKNDEFLGITPVLWFLASISISLLEPVLPARKH